MMQKSSAVAAAAQVVKPETQAALVNAQMSGDSVNVGLGLGSLPGSQANVWSLKVTSTLHR